jgi:hypothetical protein
VVVQLTVPKGTPLQVALDQEVRLREAGEPIHGRLMQSIYAFDKLVLPVGTGDWAHFEGRPNLTEATHAFHPERGVHAPA